MYRHLNQNLTLADALEEYKAFVNHDREEEIAYVNEERYRILVRFWFRDYWHVHSPCRIWNDREQAIDTANDVYNQTNVADIKVLDRWSDRIEYHRAKPSQEEADTTQQMFDLIPLKGE